MIRKVGIEEELLLVDPTTGELASVAPQVLHEHRTGTGEETASLERELLQHMVETETEPLTDLAETLAQLRAARAAAVLAAREAGAAVAATGTAPLPGSGPRVTSDPRYDRILAEFGDISRQAGTLGMHVHVDVADDEEAMRVTDGMRPWLPVLLAVAANSPYAEGSDTGHASWRQRVWSRWPTAGTAEPFGSVAEYRRVAAVLVELGAALDEGMLYFDVRPAVSYPTVEVRVADVCTDPEDALLVAALTRALVETVAGRPATDAAPVRSDILRAAHWRAARSGLADRLVDPVTWDLRAADEVIRRLVDHVAEALARAGDTERVEEALRRLSAVGGGATRQRAAFERTGSVAGVVADLVERTEGSCGC